MASQMKKATKKNSKVKKNKGIMGKLMSNQRLRYMASLKPLVYMTYLVYALLAVTAIGILISVIKK